MSAKQEWWLATNDETEELILGPFDTEAIAEKALGYAMRDDLCVIRAISAQTMGFQDLLNRLDES